MLDKMKQLMEMKKQADRIKKELDNVIVDVKEVEGISLQITGSQTFRSIEISQDMLVPENKARLEKDLLRSLNSAIKKSQKTAAEKMAASMPKIPGFNF
ncbi:MAG: YbaB/EbfC family nucleoid-associated protein [Candidatus Omnitrophota bacterium]